MNRIIDKVERYIVKEPKHIILARNFFADIFDKTFENFKNDFSINENDTHFNATHTELIKRFSEILKDNFDKDFPLIFSQDIFPYMSSICYFLKNYLQESINFFGIAEELLEDHFFKKKEELIKNNMINEEGELIL